MNNTAFERFWDLIWVAIALDPAAYELAQTLPRGTQAALVIVLLAGLSQTLGQGIVLFANQVKPLRFVLTVLLSAVLFGFSYFFWSLSTWLVCDWLLPRAVPFNAVYRTLALAFAPQLFGFLVALPYAGVTIGVVISIWTLLSAVRGLGVTLGLAIWPAFWCAALSWVVSQILQRTIGRPVTAIARWLTNQTAGVQLVTNLKAWESWLETRHFPAISASPDRVRPASPPENCVASPLENRPASRDNQ
ncbi:hypothetical protein [Trichothermofontia sp.]